MKLFSQSASKKRQRSSSIDHSELDEFRRNLPVHAYKAELLVAITKGKSVVLVTAATGSGKSTQIPAYLDQVKGIAVTQPRRVAAMTLARRVASELSTNVGGSRVGYRVRFDDCSRPDTQLVYVTDGMLLREAMVDPLLQQYSVVFLDEAHERSLATDILLGVVQRARLSRMNGSKPLRVVVMSATLQVETFRDFFGKDQVVQIDIPGRQFPVQLLYTDKPTDDYIEAALATLVQIHLHEPTGDCLCFLPGQEEIEDLSHLLQQQLEEVSRDSWTGDRVEVMNQKEVSSVSSKLVNGVMICQLYAALPPEAQLAAFDEKPNGCTRKIILATNIAETSVTLPAIRYVVDSGLHKSRHVSSATGMESLQVEPVSQAQAAQRAGRAGRTESGFCFRLYPEDGYDGLRKESIPEIQRVNLAQVVLQLKGMGISDPTTFEFVTPPDKASLVRAMKLLYALGALDDSMELSKYGTELAKLPLDPVFGHLLLQSRKYNCSEDMLTAVSVLSADHLFYRPTGGDAARKASDAHRRFAKHEGDIPTFVEVYRAWRKEAKYHPPGGKNKSNNHQSQPRMGHHEWCQRNFISGRSLARAYHVREQLSSLCQRAPAKGGLGWELRVEPRDPQDHAYEQFLRAVAAGLFLQAASRIRVDQHADSKGNSGRLGPSRGRYRTKLGRDDVSIHPTSTLFGRNPAPSCVVYTEQVTTKKTYIRGVTQIREEWLHEVAPQIYTASNATATPK